MSSTNFSSTGLRSWEMTGSFCKHTAPCRAQGDGGLAVLTFWALEETYRTAASNLPGLELICHSGRQAHLQQGAAIFESTHNATVSASASRSMVQQLWSCWVTLMIKCSFKLIY